MEKKNLQKHIRNPVYQEPTDREIKPVLFHFIAKVLWILCVSGLMIFVKPIKNFLAE